MSTPRHIREARQARQARSTSRQIYRPKDGKIIRHPGGGTQILDASGNTVKFVPPRPHIESQEGTSICLSGVPPAARARMPLSLW